jgi:exosortase A
LRGCGERWPTVVAVCVALVAVLVYSWPTLASLHLRWVGYGYSHGYLIVALAGWLAFRAATRGPKAPVGISIAGSLLFVAAATGILVAQASTTVGLAQLLLPVFWFGTVWALLGWRNARRFLLPIGYVYFAIPLWDLANSTLQSLTVLVVSSLLGWADIPVFIDGNFIHIPAGSFEVADGCSGLHYILVSLSVGAYLALAHHRRWQSRALLVALAALTALVANWVRVFSVVVAGHTTDMQHFLITHDHYYFGWGLFLTLCMVPVAAVDRRLTAGASVPSAETPAVTTLVPAKWTGSVGVALVCLVFVLMQWRVLEEGVPGRAVALGPISVVGWSNLGAWEDSSTPEFVGAGDTVTGRYVDGEDRVSLYLAKYARQGHGSEVVSDVNLPQGRNGRVVFTQATRVRGESGAEVALLELQVAGDRGESRLIWFGRRIGGRWASSDLAAKSYQIVGVVGGQHEALVLVLSTACAENCSAARARLSRFAEVMSVPAFGEGPR